jgi:hypothetical protein
MGIAVPVLGKGPALKNPDILMLVSVIGNNLPGGILGVIIENTDFIVLIILLEQMIQTAADIVLFVAAGNKDTHPGSVFSHGFLRFEKRPDDIGNRNKGNPERPEQKDQAVPAGK